MPISPVSQTPVPTARPGTFGGGLRNTSLYNGAGNNGRGQGVIAPPAPAASTQQQSTLPNGNVNSVASSKFGSFGGNNTGGGMDSNPNTQGSGDIYDWSQPQGVAPGSQLPGNVNPVQVASQRTPFEMYTPENSWTQSQILQSFYNVNPSTGRVETPNYASTTQGNANLATPELANQPYQMNNYANQALATKAGMGLSDFGIPQQIQEMMKVNAANQVNTAKEAQKAAAKRQLASMGLLNDSAAFLADQQFDQQANQNIYNQYSNIDTQNALEQNKQYQQNLSDVLGGGLKAGDQAEQARSTSLSALLDAMKQQENSRQFNITSNLDQDRLRAGVGQWLENTQENRANILNSIANFLENYQLERQKQASGLISDAAKTAVASEGNMASILRQDPIASFGTGA